MLHRFRSHARQNVVAYVALFFAVGGGSAYAHHALITADELGTTKVRTATINVPDGEARQQFSECNDGERLISGGAYWNGASTVGNVRLASGAMFGDRNPSNYTATGVNESGGGGDRTLIVQAHCLKD